MEYYLFDVLLDLLCQYFVESGFIYVYQGYWPVVLGIFSVFLSGFDIRVMLAL